jgi:hypothetical protein
MAIEKSTGVNESEQFLISLCEGTFLKLWSYPNPFTDDDLGKELCDLIAFFDNHLFIFFDRSPAKPLKLEPDGSGIKPAKWKRWKRKVVEKQIASVAGAEKYIRNGNPIFLDGKRQKPLPVTFDPATVTIHKIIVAHGAKEACEQFAEDNVSGSIGIIYQDKDKFPEIPAPFILHLDRESPIHVLDSHTLSLVLEELDTPYEFTQYLVEKERAISECGLLYCGEEDLLAHYLGNWDASSEKHYIGPGPEHDYTMIFIAEGEWAGFIQSDEYERRQNANMTSYLWDRLIQNTSQHMLDGTSWGHSEVFSGEGAMHVMAKEPRFSRRALAEAMISAMTAFPEPTGELQRMVSYYPSHYEGVGYVFLQYMDPEWETRPDEYRKMRQAILELACGVAKNQHPEIHTIVGFAMFPPKYTKGNHEDFVLFDCSQWSPEDEQSYAERNKQLRLFNPDNSRLTEKHVAEFPSE